MSNYEFLTIESFDDFIFPGLEDFIEWLDSMEADELVSENWNRHGCPLWMFLKSYGWENPTIYGNNHWHPLPQSSYTEEYTMPPWAAEFSWWEDKLVERRMTARQCLSLVNNPVFKPSMWEDGKSRPILGRVIGF